MPIHFNDFDKPSALEEKRLQELTGCPIYRRIDSACTEPGCPNNGIRRQILEETCIEDCLQDPALFASRERQETSEIYKTEPKQRCIL